MRDSIYRRSTHGLFNRASLPVFAAAIAVFPCWAVQAQGVPELPSSTKEKPAEESTAPTDSHMSEALRSSIKKVVIVPGESPANQAVTGSYDKSTKGLIGGDGADRRQIRQMRSE